MRLLFVGCCVSIEKRRNHRNTFSDSVLARVQILLDGALTAVEAVLDGGSELFDVVVFFQLQRAVDVIAGDRQ